MSHDQCLASPILEHGGPEHVRRSLKGEHQAPANYRYTSYDGTSIVYYVCGRGPKLVVVPSPGWGVGLKYMPNSFEPMIDGGFVTFVGIQTRGSSPSERPKDESLMGSRHMGDDIDALRRHLGVQSVIVAGHSNAGAIVLSFAQNYPSSCAGLVLIDTQVIGLGNRGKNIMDELQSRKDDPRYADAVNYFFENNVGGVMMDPANNVTSDEHLTGLVSGFLALYFYDPPTSMPIFVAAFGEELIIQHWAYIRQALADREPEAEALQDLHKVTAPTQIFSGQDDWICSVEGSRVVAEGIGSHAEHIVFEKCGHVPFIEEKEKFFAKLMPFVEKLPPTELA